jgi:hypothetical protein
MTEPKKQPKPKSAPKKDAKALKPKPEGELSPEQLDGVTGAGYRLSDRRLKASVESMTTCLDMVEALEPVSYRFKADGRAEIGFIAQDVRKVAPELVEEGADGYLRIAYGNLAAPLAGAIQELAGELRALRRDHTAALARIEALEAEVAPLRKARASV